MREDFSGLARDADRDERLRLIFVAKADQDVAALTAALLDPDFRDVAARALGNLGAKEAAPAITRLLDARDPKARAAAAIALGKLGAQEAGDRLLELAQNEPVDWVQMWALAALGELGRPETFQLALDKLTHPSWKVRLTAVGTLGELGDPAALEPIRRARRNEPFVVRWYAGRPGYRKAIRELQRRQVT